MSFANTFEYKQIEQNYLHGLKQKDNFDLDGQLYLTLLMKLIYTQYKNRLNEHSLVYEVALCSNPIHIIESYCIPRTIDYISG